MIWKSIKIFWQPWGCRGCPHQKNCVCLLLFDQKRPKAVVRPWLMLQKIYFMVFERYIPELKKYDSISFLHQPMASGQPLKIVQRHMAHPVLTKISFFVNPIQSKLRPDFGESFPHPLSGFKRCLFYLFNYLVTFLIKFTNLARGNFWWW